MYLFTSRVLQSFCETMSIPEMTKEKCSGVTVLSPDAFYPIPWREWMDYFDPKKKDEVKLNLQVSSRLY